MGIVIKKAISTTVINYVGVILGVINVLWLQTAIITELQVGILSYVMDVTILVLPFVMFGMSGLPGRFIHHFTEGKEHDGFISLLLIVPLIVFFILSVSTLLFKDNVVALMGDNVMNYKSYLVFIFPLVFCYVYLSILEAILVTKSLIVFPSFLKTIYRRLSLMILLIFYSFNVFDFYELIFWYTIAHFIELLMLFVFFKKSVNFKFRSPKMITKHSEKKAIISYTLFLFIGISGAVMVGKIDTIMISSITDDFKLLGVYAIAFFIAAVIEMPKRIVFQLSYPIMSRLVSEGNDEELKKIYEQSGINLSIIGVFLFLLIWYNIDELFLIIPNGEIYAAGKWVVFFIGLAKVIDAIFGTSDLMINATKYYKLNGILVPFLIILTIVSNYFLIDLYGITGAAIATSIVLLVYSCAKYFSVLFLIKMNLLTKRHIFIGINTLLVVLIFMFKTRWAENNFLEIIINSALITLVFIGGNILMKSSEELNHLIIKNFKKITGKN